MLHLADDGNHICGTHASGLRDQRGEELGLPVAAPKVVIQLTAAGVAQRLCAVHAATPFCERIIGISPLFFVDVVRFRFGQVDFHAAHGVDNRDDGGEIDAEPAVDFQVEGVLQRGNKGILVLRADDGIELYVVAALVGYDDIARKRHRVNLPFVKTDLNEHHDVASPVIIERTVIIYAQNQESFRSVRMQRDDQHQQHGKENEQHTRRLMAGEKRTDVDYFILHMS